MTRLEQLQNDRDKVLREIQQLNAYQKKVSGGISEQCLLSSAVAELRIHYAALQKQVLALSFPENAKKSKAKQT